METKANKQLYRGRVIDSLLHDKLEAMGAVLIEGPKACGKTTTAEQQARSTLYETAAKRPAKIGVPWRGLISSTFVRCFPGYNPVFACF